MALKSSKKGQNLVPTTDVYVVKTENVRNVYNLYTSNFSGLKPQQLHGYFEARRRGLNFWMSLLFEEIRRRDLRIGGICQTRKLSTVKKDFQVRYKKKSTVPQARQEEMISFVEDNFERINFANFITDIVEAQITGLSSFQILYEVVGSKVMLNEATRIQNHQICYNDLLNLYQYLRPENCDAQKLSTLSYNVQQDRIDFSKLVVENINPLNLLEVHSFDGSAPNGLMNGCVDSLSWCFYFKNYGLKDWSMYIEQIGSPAIIGKRPPIMSATDKKAFEDAVANFASLSKIVVPDGCTLEMLTDQAKSSVRDLFGNYVEFWNKEASIRVLGQSLTTDIGDVGSKAASQTHDEVRKDIQIADMILVKQNVNKLIRKIIDINFADVTEYPTWGFEEEEDTQFKLTRSEIFRNIYQSGYRVKKQNVEEEFGVEVEDVPALASPNNSGNSNEYVDNYIKQFFNAIQR